MKRKTIVLLSSILAGSLIVGGAFASYYSVVDNANPIGANVTPGSVSEDGTKYVTLSWGASTKFENAGDFKVGENRKLGIFNIVSDSTELGGYTGVVSISLEDVTAPKDVELAHMFDYLNVYIYEGAKDLQEDGSLPAGAPAKQILKNAAKDESGKKILNFNASATSAGSEYTVFVNLDSSAVSVYNEMPNDKVYIQVDWNPQAGDESHGAPVYTYKPEGWGGLYAYAWEGESVNGVWPGVEMVHVYDNVYTITIPTSFGNLLFTANDGNDAHKTADLTFSGYNPSSASYWDGTKWAAVPEKVELVVTAKVNGQAAAFEDISETSPTDKGVYAMTLAANDKVTFKDGTTDIHFYEFDTEEHDRGTEYTAQVAGKYTFYYNAQGHMYVSAPSQVVETSYYLVGTHNNWATNAQSLMTVDPADANHYSIEGVTFVAGEQIKVTDGKNNWYSNATAGEGYTVDDNVIVTNAGEYVVNFYVNSEFGNHIVIASAE